jgi:putative ABC transport system substrate-binding protein
MKRREFMTLLGGAAAWPLTAREQQPMAVIGILAVAAPEANVIRLRAFREGLRTAGYVEGQNTSRSRPTRSSLDSSPALIDPAAT